MYMHIDMPRPKIWRDIWLVLVYWSEHSHWFAAELHPIRFGWDAKTFTIPLSAAIQKVFANEFTLI